MRSPYVRVITRLEALETKLKRLREGLSGETMFDKSFLDHRTIHFAYIQIPFCISRCSYCWWSSQYSDDILAIQKFRKPLIQAIIQDVRRRSLFAQEREKVNLRIIHFGGGTPGLLTAKELRSLLVSMLDAYGQRIENMAKVAIEARPDSLSHKKVCDLRAMGFNRISLGIQTFNQNVLSRLQRHIDVDRYFRCYDEIREAGFEDVSFDMLYGLPSQTFEDIQKDMDIVVKLKPDHIDAYPWNPRNTAFGGVAEMYEEKEKAKKIEWAVYIKKVLEENGYHNYSHVCYALPDKESFLQLISASYLLPFLGFGPGAEYIFDTHVVKIRGDLRKYIRYQRAAGRFEYPDISSNNSLGEMVNIITRHLLLDEGIDLDYFKRRFGLDLEDYLRSFKDPERLREEAAKKEYQDLSSFARLSRWLKKLKRFQAWLEKGVLEKKDDHLQVKEEFKISRETWDDLYMVWETHQIPE